MEGVLAAGLDLQGVVLQIALDAGEEETVLDGRDLRVGVANDEVGRVHTYDI